MIKVRDIGETVFDIGFPKPAGRSRKKVLQARISLHMHRNITYHIENRGFSAPFNFHSEHFDVNKASIEEHSLKVCPFRLAAFPNFDLFDKVDHSLMIGRRHKIQPAASDDLARIVGAILFSSYMIGEDDTPVLMDRDTVGCDLNNPPEGFIICLTGFQVAISRSVVPGLVLPK